ncbi:MAG: AI-2E family transporter [Firmicutes bacterium]|nr:AI-2E family transporter [Bacillota bacterium]
MLKIKNKKEINVEEVNNVITLSKRILKLLYVVMIVAIVFLASILLKEWGIFTFIKTLLKVISPLFIGFVIAWLFNPAVKWLQKKGMPRIASSLLIYALFLTVLVIFIRVLVPTLYTQLNDLIGNLPTIFNSVKETTNKAFESINNMHGIDLSNVKTNLFTTLESWFNNFTTSLPESILGIITNFFSSLVVIVFGLVIGLYMLFDFDSIAGHLINLLPEKAKKDAGKLIENISTEVRKCVNGTLTVASMVFVCDSIGFAIIGLQAPVLFGLFCGLTDLIPYVGPYIGGIAAVIIGFSQSTFTGILAIVICLIVQTVENFILQPLIMSKTMKLHPVTIIIGLLIFEHFFGIVGMILATPIIALLKVIYHFVAEKFNLFELDEDELTEE